MELLLIVSDKGKLKKEQKKKAWFRHIEKKKGVGVGMGEREGM